MSWRVHILLKLAVRLGLFGFSLGILAGFVWEAWLLLPFPAWGDWLAAALLGLVLSLGLLAAWPLVHQHSHDGWWQWGYGTLNGLLAGVLAFWLAAWLSQPWLFLFLLLSFMGAGCGAYRSWRVGGVLSGGRGAAWGMLAGAVLSLPLVMLPASMWLLLGLWSVGWLWLWIVLPKGLARCWLRVLNGRLEDMCYPLWGKAVKLGTDVRNHVVLQGHAQVYPFHGCVERLQGSYQLVDANQGGEVRVNYRPVARHRLETGDLIKLGGALLQVGGTLPAAALVVAQAPEERSPRNRSPQRSRGRFSRRGRGRVSRFRRRNA